MKSPCRPDNGKMVSINFKLSDVGRIELYIDNPEPLEKVLQQCSTREGLELGHIIAIRNGSVIKGSDLVENGDAIDVFPAISGG